MSNHPQLLQTAITLAHKNRELSKCKKAKVGCVIFDDETILSSGYNAIISPILVCDSVACQVAGKNNSSNCATQHAEAMAVEELQYCTNGDQIDPVPYAYCTHFPCTSCLHLLLTVGITHIYYTQPNHFTPDLTRIFPNITFTQC